MVIDRKIFTKKVRQIIDGGNGCIELSDESQVRNVKAIYFTGTTNIEAYTSDGIEVVNIDDILSIDVE